MTGVEALELVLRLRKTHWPLLRLPWEAMGVQLNAVGSDLVGTVRDAKGQVTRLGVFPDYVWDLAAEYLPGGRIADMLQRKGEDELKAMGASTVTLSDDDKKRFPTLLDHLTQDKWPDGSSRERSKMNVWWDGSIFKVMVRDVDQKLVIFVASPSLSKLLPTLESVLSDPAADWRADQGEKWKSRRKK